MSLFAKELGRWRTQDLQDDARWQKACHLARKRGGRLPPKPVPRVNSLARRVVRECREADPKDLSGVKEMGYVIAHRLCDKEGRSGHKITVVRRFLGEIDRWRRQNLFLSPSGARTLKRVLKDCVIGWIEGILYAANLPETSPWTRSSMRDTACWALMVQWFGEPAFESEEDVLLFRECLEVARLKLNIPGDAVAFKLAEGKIRKVVLNEGNPVYGLGRQIEERDETLDNPAVDDMSGHNRMIAQVGVPEADFPFSPKGSNATFWVENKKSEHDYWEEEGSTELLIKELEEQGELTDELAQQLRAGVIPMEPSAQDAMAHAVFSLSQAGEWVEAVEDEEEAAASVEVDAKRQLSQLGTSFDFLFMQNATARRRELQFLREQELYSTKAERMNRFRRLRGLIWTWLYKEPGLDNGGMLKARRLMRAIKHHRQSDRAGVKALMAWKKANTSRLRPEQVDDPPAWWKTEMFAAARRAAGTDHWPFLKAAHWRLLDRIIADADQPSEGADPGGGDGEAYMRAFERAYGLK